MKKIYKQPVSRIVSYTGEEELLLPYSWNGSWEDESNMDIIEGDPEGDGKGVKEDKESWSKDLWNEVW